MSMAEHDAKAMPEVVNFPKRGDVDLTRMSDSELTAQDIVQNGAIHALQTLIRRGASRENAEEMLRDLVSNRRLIQQEARRRDLKAFVSSEFDSSLGERK
jgi:16S rRNA C1402 N4-methylase RsmH